MDSPPLTPLRSFNAKPGSPLSQRRPVSLRSSSFSSTQSLFVDRRRSTHSNHRLSTSSRFSYGYDDPHSPMQLRNRNVSGVGTLADELDSADEDDWGQGDSILVEEDGQSQQDELECTADESLCDPPQADGARDSGVDISYHVSPIKTKAMRRKAAHTQRLAEAPVEFTRELEDAIEDITTLASAPAHVLPDTVQRTLTALRELNDQAQIESLTHRLATSSNSVATQTTNQTKQLQSSMSALLSPLGFSPALHAEDIDELLALHAQVQQCIPYPDPTVTQQLSKITRDTLDLRFVLSGLLDSLQMAKQISTSAARTLKGTYTMVEELRREGERAEEGAFYIEREDWDRKLESRWCAGQCKDVIDGFDIYCDVLRMEFLDSAA